MLYGFRAFRFRVAALPGALRRFRFCKEELKMSVLNRFVAFLTRDARGCLSKALSLVILCEAFLGAAAGQQSLTPGAPPDRRHDSLPLSSITLHASI